MLSRATAWHADALVISPGSASPLETGPTPPGLNDIFHPLAGYVKHLGTSVGSMHGSYQMVTADGERFDAVITPFTLAMPNALN